MGTRAKRFCHDAGYLPDYTYGVVDKCLLSAMKGEDTLILTCGGMAGPGGAAGAVVCGGERGCGAGGAGVGWGKKGEAGMLVPVFVCGCVVGAVEPSVRPCVEGRVGQSSAATLSAQVSTFARMVSLS